MIIIFMSFKLIFMLTVKVHIRLWKNKTCTFDSSKKIFIFWWRV